jgi:hypothetical protein
VLSNNTLNSGGFSNEQIPRVRSIVLKFALTIPDSGCYSLTGSVGSAYRSKLLLLLILLLKRTRFIYFSCWQIHGKIILNNQRIKQLIKQNRFYHSYIRNYSRNYHFKETSFDKTFAAIIKKRAEDDSWVFK